jgi:hypothetical protein
MEGLVAVPVYATVLRAASLSMPSTFSENSRNSGLRKHEEKIVISKFYMPYFNISIELRPKI